MKITTDPAPPTFVPRSMTITFETQDEMDALGNLLNHGATHDAAHPIYSKKGLSIADMTQTLRANIKALGGNPSAHWDDFNTNVKAWIKSNP